MVPVTLFAVMPLPRHLPHVIYATALTSLSLHLLGTKKNDQESRKASQARISVLEGLSARLRAGEELSNEDFIKAWKLSRGSQGEGEEQYVNNVKEGDVDWKTVALGRSGYASSVERDEEKLKKLWEEGKPANTGSFPCTDHVHHPVVRSERQES